MPSSADSSLPACTDELREKLIAAHKQSFRDAVARMAGKPFEQTGVEDPEKRHATHAEYINTLLAGPLAPLLAKAAECDAAVAIDENALACWRARSRETEDALTVALRDLAAAQAEAERLRAAAAPALSVLDWQGTQTSSCGDPNYECPMQDINKPDDEHLLARIRLRDALAPSPAQDKPDAR